MPEKETLLMTIWSGDGLEVVSRRFSTSTGLARFSTGEAKAKAGNRSRIEESILKNDWVELASGVGIPCSVVDARKRRFSSRYQGLLIHKKRARADCPVPSASRPFS